MKDYIIVAVIILTALILIGLIIYFTYRYIKKGKTIDNESNEPNPNKGLYIIKQKYLSDCEQEYFSALKNIIGDKFIIYPQVPLSQIIEKKTKGFANELYRVIDFCIFSYQMKPLVCIEINDSTHNQYDRIKRDKKVKDILSTAGLPLINLWTSYGMQPDYIHKRLQDYINV